VNCKKIIFIDNQLNHQTRNA